MSNASVSKKDLFLIVSDWLKFAEAKNAALIAACGIFVPVLIGLTSQESVLGQLYGWSGLLFLASAAFLAIISFLPRLRYFDEHMWSPQLKPTDVGSIYFGDIASMTQKDFVESFCSLYGEESLSELDQQLAIQTHVNARIAFKKFRIFTSACWCFLAAVFTPAVFLALAVLSKNDDI